jgi:hypothetical protein
MDGELGLIIIFGLLVGFDLELLFPAYEDSLESRLINYGVFTVAHIIIWFIISAFDPELSNILIFYYPAVVFARIVTTEIRAACW